MLKNNKGITLIALVITIIVLLILAGVSIAMLTGDNGILTQAGNAQTATREAEIKEAISLAVSTVNADLADNISTPVYTSFDLDNIIKAINADRGAGTASKNGTDKIDYKYGNKYYVVSLTVDASNKTVTNISVATTGTDTAAGAASVSE